MFVSLQADPLSVEIKSQAAVLYNPDNGVVLFEKKSKEPFYPASITKVATAAYVLSQKEQQLDQEISAEQESLASITESAKKKAQYTLPGYWLETDSCHIGIKVGEKLRLRDLLAGMLICSGNDAANVSAQSCERNLNGFAKKLNGYVKRLGCKKTHFVNPHGLHHPEHVTTAYDMALICTEALRYPFFRETVSKTFYLRPETNKHPEARLSQTNRLLKKGKVYYPKAFGVKTGYTCLAQSTLVAAAEDNGRVLIAVLLKCKEREEIFKDAIKLFNAAFNESRRTKVYLDPGLLPFSIPLDGANYPLKLYTTTPLSISSFPAEEPQIKAVLAWEPLTFPIKASQKVGILSLVDPSGKIHAQVDLFSVEKVSSGWFSWLLSFF